MSPRTRSRTRSRSRSRSRSRTRSRTRTSTRTRTSSRSRSRSRSRCSQGTRSAGLRVVRALPALVAGALAVLLLAPAARADVRSGDKVVIAATDVVAENLYVSAGDVQIAGSVVGDVVALCGKLTIDGAVDGDVVVGAGTLVINGTVRGDVRGAAGDVTLNGSIAGDASIAAGQLRALGVIGGDAMLAGGAVRQSGPVGRDLYIGAGEARIAGDVGRNAAVQAASLTLEQRANIGGSLRYVGQEALVQDGSALVVGKISEERINFAPTPGQRIAAWLQLVIGVFALTMLWSWLFRGFVRRATTTLRTRKGASFAVGCAAFFGTPPALLAVLVLGALVGGWWLAGLGLSIYVFAIALGLPLVAVLFGDVLSERFLSERTPAWARAAVALLALLLVGQVPIIGTLALGVATLFGLGAVVLTSIPTLRKTRLDSDQASSASSATASPPSPPAPAPAPAE